nr:hypothetical protein [Tanacetum cinerariifolium]
MENTMFELVKICQEKEFLCIHDDINDLIESALDSKLLLINSNSQHLEKKEQEVKNVVEQPAEHGNRSIQSLQNFIFVRKSSISFKNKSKISSIHSVAPIQSTKEPEHLLSMRYEHPSITPETESDEVTEFNTENLLPIPSKCEVTLEDEIERIKIYSNPLCDEDKINSDKLDPYCFNVESDFVESLLNRDTFIDFSSKFNFSGELTHIKPEIPKSDFDFEEEICLIENLLYDNSFPRPPEELNAEIAYTIIESIPLLPILVQVGNSQQEKIDIVTETDDVLPPSIENFADDPEGDIRFLEELLINDSILSDELSDANFEENPSIPRPPPKPPDVETDTGEEISVVMNDKDEDVDYSSFIFVIYPEMFSFLLSAKSEDTIFNPVHKVERQSTKEEKGKKSDDSSKPTRKKTLARKRAGGNDSQESVKKQKLEDDTKKKELKAYLDIVPEDESIMEVKSLATKYPIIDWKTHVLTEHFMYYQIIRADGSSKNYKIFSEMLDDFDKQDVMDLHRLVEERYTTTSLEGYDLMLWGDLKTLFEPDEENELWKNQHEYNLIS